jgi:AcrR family transcriptional regulator
MRRPREAPEVQRARILSGSVAVFDRLGYANTTMGDIAQESNVSRTLLYHYFGNKEQIFEGLLLEFIDRLDPLLERLRSHAGTTEEQIRGLVDGYHDAMTAEPELARLCAELTMLPDAPTTPAYEKRIAYLRTSLIDWVDRLGPDVRADADREQFLLLVASVLILWFLPTPVGRALGAGDQSPAAVERHKNAVCDLLLHGLVDGASPAGARKPGRATGTQRRRRTAG